jgi:hypothetical protein
LELSRTAKIREKAGQSFVVFFVPQFVFRPARPRFRQRDGSRVLDYLMMAFADDFDRLPVARSRGG